MTLSQGQQYGYQNICPCAYVNHVRCEGNSFKDFPRKLKSIWTENSKLYCHSMDSWSVHRGSACEWWSVLMCRLDTVFFKNICNIWRVIWLLLSIEHWTGNYLIDSPSTAVLRHWQTGYFLFIVWNSGNFCILTVVQLLMIHNFATFWHLLSVILLEWGWTCMPLVFLSTTTTRLQFYKFISSSWQLAWWRWFYCLCRWCCE